MQPNLVSGQAVGSIISVADSTELAGLSPQGIAFGTQIYNIGTGTYFALTVSTAALVTNRVVAVNGVTGLRWVAQASTTSSWIADRLAEVQGIAPTLARYTQFATWNITEDVTANTASGTGTVKPATNVPGGAWDFASGASANGQQLLVNRDFSAGALAPRFVTSAKTTVWATVARVQTLVSPDSATRYTFGDCADASTDIWVGLDGSVSTTNLSVRVVGGTETTFDSGLAWPGNSTWHNVAQVFDGTKLWVMLDGVVSATGLSTLTNFPSGAAGAFRLFAANGATASNKEFQMARYAIITADV